MNTQFSGYEYIRYLYSALLQTTNIFDICIRSIVRIWIYSIFVFGKIFYKYVLIYRKVFYLFIYYPFLFSLHRAQKIVDHWSRGNFYFHLPSCFPVYSCFPWTFHIFFWFFLYFLNICYYILILEVRCLKFCTHRYEQNSLFLHIYILFLIQNYKIINIKLQKKL